MLTRRHVRIKIMQSVYALSNGNQNSLTDEVKFIKNSLTGVFDLYLIKLAFFKALHQHATNQGYSSKGASKEISSALDLSIEKGTLIGILGSGNNGIWDEDRIT